MNRTSFAFLGATLVIAGLLIGTLVAPRFLSTTGSVGSWRDYASAESLIGESDRIVVGQYMDEESHVKPEISAATGEEKGSVSHVFRQFRVVETLKGDAAVGDTFFVAFTTGYTTILDNGESEFTSFEVVDVSSGQEYLLFLRGTSRQDGYPVKYGSDIQWAITGEPGMALVGEGEGGDLSFKSTPRYKDEQGLPPEVGAPFALTKEQVRSLASSSP